MKIIQFLEQYENADRVVNRLEREYEEQRIMIDSIRSTSDNDGMPHGTNTSRPTEEKAIKLSDKLLELSEARRRAVEVRQTVFDFVDTIPGVEGDVLYRRYVRLQRWETIAEEMNYSRSGIFAVRERAINIADSKLNGHEQ
jgi:hypothetical protein